jgi:hypothetical protein
MQSPRTDQRSRSGKGPDSPSRFPAGSTGNRNSPLEEKPKLIQPLSAGQAAPIVSRMRRMI